MSTDPNAPMMDDDFKQSIEQIVKRAGEPTPPVNGSRFVSVPEPLGRSASQSPTPNSAPPPPQEPEAPPSPVARIARRWEQIKRSGTLTGDDAQGIAADLEEQSEAVILKALDLVEQRNGKPGSWRYMQSIYADARAALGSAATSKDYTGYATNGDTPPPECAAIPVSDRVDNEHPGMTLKTPRMVWDTTLNQLSIQLDRGDFRSWVSDVALVDFDAATGTFTLAARDQNARDQCQHRLGRSIGRLLRDVAGIDVGFEFKTKDELREAIPT